MVPARRRYDAHRWYCARQQAGEGPAGLERRCTLQQLQLEDHARQPEAEVGAGDVDDRRLAYVGLNERVGALDIRSIDRVTHRVSRAVARTPRDGRRAPALPSGRSDRV